DRLGSYSPASEIGEWLQRTVFHCGRWAPCETPFATSYGNPHHLSIYAYAHKLKKYGNTDNATSYATPYGFAGCAVSGRCVAAPDPESSAPVVPARTAPPERQGRDPRLALIATD